SITSIDPEAQLKYSIDDGRAMDYAAPILVDRSCRITAYDRDKRVEANFTKVGNDLSIQLLSTFAPQYNAGGTNALIDGLRGGKDFRTGQWQGFQGQDLVVEIDLGRPRKIGQ